jgi:asparagine synthase (glutamine-hydrolysing)
MRRILPAEILTRPKMGFPVPVGEWFRSSHRRILDRTITSERSETRGIFSRTYVREMVERHARGEFGYDQKLWILVNLELWQRIFIDGEPVESVGRDIGYAPELAA